ncbi:MAG: sulfotransferase family 2 domain-containing protein [Gemmatimonadaceae bacterium]|nr:sulfotransferase family 2 domain-containing protein [Gemmatimonadaceae bacterium]
MSGKAGDRDHMVLVVSLHIPKTGGSTLGRILETRFADKLQRAYQPPREGLSKTGSDGWPDLAEPQCIHGHSVIDRFGSVIRGHPNVRWITMLREPLSSAISIYHHKRNYQPWDPSSEETFEDEGLDTFLDKGYNHNRYQQWLTMAEMTVRKFSFVGIMEMFDESMFLMYKELDWEPIHYDVVNRGNYDRSSTGIGREARERFTDRNLDDYRIYQEAVEYFHETRRSQGESYPVEYRRFAEELEARRRIRKT